MKKAIFLLIICSMLLIGIAEGFICQDVIIQTSNSQFQIISNEFSLIIIDGNWIWMNQIYFRVVTPLNMHFRLIRIRDVNYGELLMLKPLNSSININLEFYFNLTLAGDPVCNGASSSNWNGEKLSVTANTNEIIILVPYWWERQIPMYMGLIGLIFIILAPTITIYELKEGNYSWLAWGLLMGILGIGMLIGWLWA